MRKIAIILSIFCTIAVYAQEEGVRGRRNEKIPVGNNVITAIADTSASRSQKENLSGIKVASNAPKHSFILNLGYNFPSINNNLTGSDYWNKKTGSGQEIEVDYRRQFLKDGDETTPGWLSWGIGGWFGRFHQSAGFESFSETLSDYTDADKGDKCNVYLDYQNIEESVTLAYLSPLVYLEIGKLSLIKTSWYLRVSAKPSWLVAKSFSGTGTYTSTAHYPEKDYPLHDVPVLGYYTDKACYDNPAYELSSFVLWGSISAGVNFPLRPFTKLENDKFATWILRASAKIDYSITPVSKSLDDSYFAGSAYRINQSNMLGGDGSRIFSFGLSLGLIYCIK